MLKEQGVHDCFDMLNKHLICLSWLCNPTVTTINLFSPVENALRPFLMLTDIENIETNNIEIWEGRLYLVYTSLLLLIDPYIPDWSVGSGQFMPLNNFGRDARRRRTLNLTRKPPAKDFYGEPSLRLHPAHQLRPRPLADKTQAGSGPACHRPHPPGLTLRI